MPAAVAGQVLGAQHLAEHDSLYALLNGGIDGIDSSAIHKTLADAKGDLLVATANDTFARFPVGADDTILMADSAAGSGVKWVGPGTPSTQAFGDAANQGSDDTYTRGGHKHAMPAMPVTTIKKTGASSLTGNVTLTEGGNITLTQTGNDITIASTGGTDASAIHNSFVNAKGDIVTATANDTPSILTVGTDGTRLEADSSASSGLVWKYGFGKVYNLADYGPTGDGVADDTTAVRAWTAAPPSTGGRMIVPAGKKFLLTATSKNLSGAGAVYSGSPETVTFTVGTGHGWVAQDVVNVIDVNPVLYNQVYLIKSVTSTTIVCYADKKGNPGSYVSGGTVVGVGAYIRDKAGIVVEAMGGRTQGQNVGGSWFIAGTRGMILLCNQKNATSDMTHSGVEMRNVGFVDPNEDVNLHLGVNITWAADQLTFDYGATAHGHTTGDIVHVFNTGGGVTMDVDGTYTVLSSGLTSTVFKVTLVGDPGGGDATTGSTSFEILPDAKTPKAVGLVTAGTTRWYNFRNMYLGLRYGHVMLTANSKDVSWGEEKAMVSHHCINAFKILGNGGQSVYINGGNLIMHTGQKGICGPGPEETSNDGNHMRVWGQKFDTQYTSGAGCMGVDNSLAHYVTIGPMSFEIEGDSTTRAVRLGSTKGGDGLIQGITAQHNGFAASQRDGTAIEVLGSDANNPAAYTIVGCKFTNWKVDIHIGPYAQGCSVIGGVDTRSSITSCTGIEIHDATTVFGTTITNFKSIRSAGGTWTNFINVNSNTDVRYSDCWDYGNGVAPVWWDNGGGGGGSDTGQFTLSGTPDVSTATGAIVGLAVTNAVWQWNGASAATLHSITGQVEGRVVVIENVTAAQTLTLSHLSSTEATAAKKFRLPAHVDTQIPPDSAVAVIWEGVVSRWRILGNFANLTGDVTTSGTMATTIASGAVTYAKMQNVAATNRFLGRITAGAGVVEELTPANAKTILGYSFSDLTGLLARTQDNATYPMARFSMAGGATLTTGQLRSYMNGAWTITSVRVSAGTAPTGTTSTPITGASLVVDVNLNGTTIWATQGNRANIQSGNNTGNATTFDTTAVSNADYFTVDIDFVGSTIAGSDVTVEIWGTKA